MVSKVRKVRTKPTVKWWRGYELYFVIGIFWFVVIGVWLALILGSQTTGAHVSGNPIAADAQMAKGHMKWPGGWATALLVLEAAFLAVLGWLLRKILTERAVARQARAKEGSS